MDKVAECCTTHLIEHDGTFNAERLDNFVKQVKLLGCGLSYVVVAVMGPQSSGKSTLLNHLFHTNFVEMNAERGRNQTTKGIWIARCTDIEPCTIVMDVEGTDGQERGEDNTFEKQSALFAMAVSDILIINMWCHDIGREHAANKPLLKTVFEVMLRLFIPRKTLRKRTLMFVIRDKTTKTPFERLETDLTKEVKKIWDSVRKPETLIAAELRDFFNVKVDALSNYEDKEEQFKEEVASLRYTFYNSIAPGGIACDREGVIPASGFYLSTKDIWKAVKENKDLDIPSHTIMVATVRCNEIASECYSSFVANTDWLGLEVDVKSHLVLGFGKTLNSLIENCLSNYDKEVKYYDGDVGSRIRKQLSENLMHHVQPAYMLISEHIHAKALDIFKTTLQKALSTEGCLFGIEARQCTKFAMNEFDELCKDATSVEANWDSTKIRDKFSKDLDSHIIEVQTAKLQELTKLYESNISKAICSPVQALLEKGTDNTWLAIRTHLHRETDAAVANLSFALSAFEMDESKMKVITSELKSFARKLVEGEARDDVKNVLLRMKDRFTFIFNHDDHSMPRVKWTENDDIRAIAENTRTSCLKMLSVMAAIRLDECTTDPIWDTLVLLLAEANTNTPTVNDPLASNKWEKVTTENTLITPIECTNLWKKFQSETETTITQAVVSQDSIIHFQDSIIHLQEQNNRINNASDNESDVLDPFSHHLGMAIGHGIGIVTLPIRRGLETIRDILD